MLLLGTDPLTAFLRAAARRPFAWGEWDCLQWLAAWALQRRGVDPGAAWRPRYRDPKGAMRLVKEAGGMVAHVERCVAPFGIRRTATPRRGDIAVVRHPPLGETASRAPFDHMLGAIVLAPGKTVAAMDVEGGIAIVPNAALPLVAAWRL